MVVRMLIVLVNIESLISKRFEYWRFKHKMVEEKDEFMVTDENTKIKSVAIQSNKTKGTTKIKQIEEKVTMPTVHDIKRKVLKQHGTECVNVVLNLKIRPERNPNERW